MAARVEAFDRYLSSLVSDTGVSMFLEKVFAGSATPHPTDLAGRYAFYDDGWMGMLHIHQDARNDGQLQATYRSYRFRSSHAVTFLPRNGPPHAVCFAIEDFNELPRQLFRGYFFTDSRNAIAGTTEWKGIPFGFFARKTRPSSLGLFGSEKLETDNFRGVYSISCNGTSATMHLDVVGPSTLTGTLRSRGEEVTVSGQVDESIPHKVILTMGDRDRASRSMPMFTGFLFTRPKSAVAGWAEWRDVRVGWYMVRHR